MTPTVEYNIEFSPALRAITDERFRAHGKHSAQGRSCEQMDHDNPIWLAVLTEEVGEVARGLCDRDSSLGDWAHIRTELIQVAAMAAAWADAIGRHLESRQ